MMKDIHSLWAYFVIAILLFTVVNACMGFFQKKVFTSKDLRLGLFTLIFSHLQLLIGLGWYFMSPAYQSMKANGIDASNRLLAVEHPFIMVVAIVLITMGWSKHKKQVRDASKFKTFAVFYGLALLLILSRIPWAQWLG